MSSQVPQQPPPSRQPTTLAVCSLGLLGCSARPLSPRLPLVTPADPLWPCLERLLSPLQDTCSVLACVPGLHIRAPPTARFLLLQSRRGCAARNPLVCLEARVEDETQKCTTAGINRGSKHSYKEGGEDPCLHFQVVFIANFVFQCAYFKYRLLG